VSMAQWPTFARMRGDQCRDWLRRSDLLDATEKAGRRLTEWQLRRAIAHLPRPAVKRYGHLHYTLDHLEAAVSVARRLAT